MSWLSLLPPLLAILIAVLKREVIIALISALLTAELILNRGHVLEAMIASIDRITLVFSSEDNTRILIFSLAIGALLAIFRLSGGVNAFVRYLLASGIARGPRSVSMLTCILGTVIFIESNLSVLTSGTFAQSLFDRFGLSRARLAFLVDSTCAPVSVLFLLNGWGAYVLGLLAVNGAANPVSILLASIPLNFYALLILIMAYYTAWTGHVSGALATHETTLAQCSEAEADDLSGKIRYFLVPLFVMVGGIIMFMLYTGSGDLIQGDGARSVLYAIALALLVAWLLMRFDKGVAHTQLIETSFRGMGELLPVVGILLLAFALGAAMKDLQTGQYIASLIPTGTQAWLMAPAVFLAACLISFTTGTSWGTFGILVPVILPIAMATNTSEALLLAAVLGGGVFGDHCSPISDSTVLSSLASGCEHLLHVRTQLPYALAAGGLSVMLFALAGVLQG